MKRNRSKQLLDYVKKEKSELEKLKQTDGASSSGKKKMVDEQEEKTKSGSSGSGKQTSHKTEINMNDLRCNKKLLKSVNKQLKSLHLMSDSSSNSDNSSDDSENYSTTSGAMIKKKKKKLKKCTVSFSDTSSSDTSSSHYTYNTRKGKHVSNSSESDNSSDYKCKKRHKKI